MYAYFHDLHVGQRITVYYRQRFESRVVEGVFVALVHDTLTLRADGQNRATHIAECDIISIGRQQAYSPLPQGSVR